MTSTSNFINTFPPLISGTSLDFNSKKQFFGKEVFGSCVFGINAADPFFSPTTLSHTGYASDGKLYASGVLQTFTDVSSWTNPPVDGTAGSTGTDSGIILDDGRVLQIDRYNTTTHKNLYATVNLEDSLTNLALNPIVYYNDSGTKRSILTPRDATFKLLKMLDGKIMILGGLDKTIGVPAGTQVKSLEVFDPVSNTWFAYSSILPVELSKFSVIVLENGSVLITGGFLGNTSSPNTNTYIFDPSTDTIQTLSISIGRENANLWQINSNEVLVMAGRNTTTPTADTTQVLKIDLSNYTVTNWIVSLPLSVYNHGFALSEDQAYFVCGQLTSDDTFTSAIIGLNRKTGLATVLYSGGLALAYRGVSVLDDGKLIIAGGYDGTVLKNTVGVFNPANPGAGIVAITNLDSNYSGSAVFYRSGKIVVIGCNQAAIDSFSGNFYGLSIHTYLPSPEPQFASWYTEVTSGTRGPRKEFPNYGLVIVSDAGLGIFDQQDHLSTWMLFLRGDALALTNTFIPGQVATFVPTKVSYENGKLFVVMQRDPGSIEVQSPLVVTIDFVNDRIYLQTTDNT